MAGKSEYQTDAVLNVLRGTDITAPAAVYVGLLSALPADDSAGGTELTGSGYERQEATFGAPGAGTGNARKVANSAPITFGPATVDWLEAIGFGVYDAETDGNLLYWDELLGEPIIFTVDPDTDTFTASTHGLSNGQRVQVRNEDGALPGNLSAASVYYVIGSAENTFQLSATSGGAAVNVSSAGNGTNSVRLDYTTTVTQGGSAQIATGALSVVED